MRYEFPNSPAAHTTGQRLLKKLHLLHKVLWPVHSFLIHLIPHLLRHLFHCFLLSLCQTMGWLFFLLLSRSSLVACFLSNWCLQLASKEFLVWLLIGGHRKGEMFFFLLLQFHWQFYSWGNEGVDFLPPWRPKQVQAESLMGTLTTGFGTLTDRLSAELSEVELSYLSDMNPLKIVFFSLF